MNGSVINVIDLKASLGNISLRKYDKKLFFLGGVYYFLLISTLFVVSRLNYIEEFKLFFDLALVTYIPLMFITFCIPKNEYKKVVEFFYYKMLYRASHIALVILGFIFIASDPINEIVIIEANLYPFCYWLVGFIAVYIFKLRNYFESH